VVTDARNDDFVRDEGFNIGAELREVFGRGGGTITF
jgi:hypothetical protein